MLLIRRFCDGDNVTAVCVVDEMEIIIPMQTFTAIKYEKKINVVKLKLSQALHIIILANNATLFLLNKFCLVKLTPLGLYTSIKFIAVKFSVMSEMVKYILMMMICHDHLSTCVRAANIFASTWGHRR